MGHMLGEGDAMNQICIKLKIQANRKSCTKRQLQTDIIQTSLRGSNA